MCVDQLRSRVASTEGHQPLVLLRRDLSATLLRAADDVRECSEDKIVGATAKAGTGTASSLAASANTCVTGTVWATGAVSTAAPYLSTHLNQIFFSYLILFSEIS